MKVIYLTRSSTWLGQIVYIFVCAMVLRLWLVLSGGYTQIAALLPPQIWGGTWELISSRFPRDDDAAGLGITTIVERIDLASEA